MKKLLKFIGIAVCIILFLQYRLYSSDALEGFVYDAETNQPLEEVEVEICWILHYGIVLHMTSTINSFKTRTDKNGYFYFPAWSPKLDGRRRFSDSRISFNRENYERETFGYHERYYGSLFFDSWVIIGRTKYGYDNIDNKIRLKRLKSNVKK